MRTIDFNKLASDNKNLAKQLKEVKSIEEIMQLLSDPEQTGLIISTIKSFGNHSNNAAFTQLHILLLRATKANCEGTVQTVLENKDLTKLLAQHSDIRYLTDFPFKTEELPYFMKVLSIATAKGDINVFHQLTENETVLNSVLARCKRRQLSFGGHDYTNPQFFEQLLTLSVNKHPDIAQIILTNPKINSQISNECLKKVRDKRQDFLKPHTRESLLAELGETLQENPPVEAAGQIKKLVQTRAGSR